MRYFFVIFPYVSYGLGCAVETLVAFPQRNLSCRYNVDYGDYFWFPKKQEQNRGKFA